MDTYDLGVLVRDIGNFDMSTFNGRLIFQKTMQLLQSFGLDFGYHYSWYLRGPYCPSLAKDGFELKEVIQDIPAYVVEFADGKNQARYEEFKKFLSDKKVDHNKLEIASSICFLYKEEHLDKETVLRLTEGKRSHFTKQDCVDIWNELENYGVVES